MKLYYVSYGGKIAGSHDYCYVMAENEQDAIKKAKLNEHKLSADFLNKYSRIFVREA